MSATFIDRRFPSYFRIQSNIFEFGLSATQLAVFMALCSFMDNVDHTAFPTYKAIASKAKVSPNTARRAIKELEALSLLKIEKQIRSDGSQTSNKYTLVFADPPQQREGDETNDAQREGGVSPVSGGGITRERGGVSPVSTHELDSSNYTQVTTLSDASASEAHTPQTPQASESPEPTRESEPPPTEPPRPANDTDVKARPKRKRKGGRPALTDEENRRAFDVAAAFGEWHIRKVGSRQSLTNKAIAIYRQGQINAFMDQYPDATPENMTDFLKWYDSQIDGDAAALSRPETIIRRYGEWLIASGKLDDGEVRDPRKDKRWSALHDCYMDIQAEDGNERYTPQSLLRIKLTDLWPMVRSAYERRNKAALSDKWKSRIEAYAANNNLELTHHAEQ